MDTYDVAVVGAGPAGAVAAGFLAAEGARVVLVEKSSLPRRKVCGGGLVRRAAAMLPTDIATVVERKCSRVELTIGSRPLRFLATRQEPVILMVERERFDYLLVRKARRQGADIRSSCTVRGLRPGAGHVDLETSRGGIRAGFVVAADGALSKVAGLAGWQDTRRMAVAVECTLPMAACRLKRFSHAAGFDFGAMPGGYGWRFPKKNRLGIGVVSMLPRPINLKGTLRRYMELLGLGNQEGCSLRAGLIPVSPRTDGFVKGRVLLTGDAAGLADPLTAEGLSHAVSSGRLAAEALLETGFEPQHIRRIYHLKLKARILDELKIARFFANLIFFHPRITNMLFSLWGQDFVEGVTDIACGRTTYRILFRNPMNYIRLFGTRAAANFR